ESEKRRYQPTASRITSGSNWRHLNSPEIDGARSIGPAYQVKPPNLQHFHFRRWLLASATATSFTILCTISLNCMPLRHLHVSATDPCWSAAGANVGLLHR